MANRAYSILTLKSVNDEQRIIEGIASTPIADRAGDIVESMGAEFKLPMPFLWQHDSHEPIGWVTHAKLTKAGIYIKAQIAKIDEPGKLKDRVDEAWGAIKSKLVGGLSIGFKPIESARIEGTYSLRFIKWLWLELSAVTIPANADASISLIKSFDVKQRAASGRALQALTSPGVTGGSTSPTKGAGNMDIKKMIADLEAKRAASAARMQAIMAKSIEESRETDDAEREEFDDLASELEGVDDDLRRLRSLAKALDTATPADGTSPRRGADSRSGTQPRAAVVKANLPPGIAFARVAKCLALSQKLHRDAISVAKELYGDDQGVETAVKEMLAISFKAEVPGGTSAPTSWSGGLVGSQGSAFADFVEWLRPTTILGKFGQGGVPALNNVPFRLPLIGQTSGGSAAWVGEGNAKPLTKFGFERSTLDPLKLANIAVVTEEVLRDSSPSAERILRDELGNALRERMDIDFILPANAGTAGIKPASILYGISAIVSSGNDEASIDEDIRTLMATFIAANNSLSNGVWLMSEQTALGLSLIKNMLGAYAFPEIGLKGGSLSKLPAITSENVGNIVALVNASDIYLADEGGVSIDMSRETSLEMSDAPSSTVDDLGSPPGVTAASMVSMFQTNSVAFRAERTINWKRRRATAARYLSAVSWGQPTTSP